MCMIHIDASRRQGGGRAAAFEQARPPAARAGPELTDADDPLALLDTHADEARSGGPRRAFQPRGSRTRPGPEVGYAPSSSTNVISMFTL